MIRGAKNGMIKMHNIHIKDMAMNMITLNQNLAGALFSKINAASIAMGTNSNTNRKVLIRQIDSLLRKRQAKLA